MGHRVPTRDPRAGFNLMAVSVIVAVAGLILVANLPGGRGGDVVLKAADTTTKLGVVEQKMVSFMAQNGRRPCPADGQYDINSSNFGIEAANPGTCTGGTPAAPLSLASSAATITGITQASPAVLTTSAVHGFTVGMAVTIWNVGGMTQLNGNTYTVTTVPSTTTFTVTDMYGGVLDSTNLPAYTSGGTVTSVGVVSGVIPTKTLGLDDSYAFDQWGRRITYIVDTRATNQITCSDAESATPANPYTGKGGITIESTTGGTITDHVMVAYVSHGPDGHGAWPAQGSSIANRINTGTADADKLTNAGENSGYATSFTNVKVQKAATSTFGDIVYYNDYYKNTCCVGPYCANYGFRVDGGSSYGGSYTANQGAGGVVIGDVNGDGIADIISGSTANGPTVAFGSSTAFPNPLYDITPIPSFNGANGFVSSYGWDSSVFTGDINGDGVADIVTTISTNTQATYVIFGKSTWSASIDPRTLADGTHGFMIATAGVTYHVMGVGDINGDGYADIFVSDDTDKRIYVIFGGPTEKNGTAWPATVDPTVLANGTNGFWLDNSGATGINTSGPWYDPVVFADVNGDGVVDLLDGTSGNGVTGGYNAHGAMYILFGSNVGNAYWTGINGKSLATLDDGTHGTYFYATSGDGWIGDTYAVGSVNGGTSSTLFVLGPGGISSTTSTVYMIPLSAITWGATSYNMSAMAGVYTITYDGNVNHYGLDNRGIAIADLNGDGINDIILSCDYCVSQSPYGYIYVLYGTSSTGSSSINLQTSPLNGSNGFLIECSYPNDFNLCGSGTLNYGALTTGDINGDGVADLIINNASGNTSRGNGNGYTYVLYGHNHASSTYWPNPFPLGTYIQ